jgi:hypothetical protein
MWFSLLELLVLLGVGAWQVYSLRSFFERTTSF